MPIIHQPCEADQIDDCPELFPRVAHSFAKVPPEELALLQPRFGLPWMSSLIQPATSQIFQAYQVTRLTGRRSQRGEERERERGREGEREGERDRERERESGREGVWV